MNRRLLALWGPFIGALAFVFWLSSLHEVPGARYVWDKLLHVVGSMGIGVLALRSFHGGLERPRARPTLDAAITVVLWSISDEIHQSFVPGRDGSALDVLADVVGFALAVLLMTIVTPRAGGARSPG